MKPLTPMAFLLLLTLATRFAQADEVVLEDLRRVVPADCYLVVHGQHNPERDYQRVYADKILNTIREARLIEHCVETATSQMAEAEREQALEWLEEFETATSPIDLQALLESPEAVYAQRMEPFTIHNSHGNDATIPTSQHLVLLRLTSAAAQDYERGIKGLFALMERGCDVTIETERHEAMTLTTMSPLDKTPYRPAIVRLGDVLMLSSSAQFARDSLAMLGNDEPSKFDDPRLAEALRELPAPEDATVFYDGRLQFEQMREMIDMLRRLAGDNPQADRWMKLTTAILDEVAILDYLAAVEFTDGNRNCTETLGKLMPHSEHRLLTEMLAGGEPFVDWHRWIPANATAYSLSMGADFHPLYRRTVSFIEEQIPELRLPLEKFEKWQRRIDLDVDVDLLQAFSGEFVSVALPAERSSWVGGDHVWALRCHKPARIGWLLERLVHHLNQHPLIESQNLALVESEELEGFQELSATLCDAFGFRPVVGFQEGWMFIGSSAEALQQVLRTRAGEADSIVENSAFQQFGMEIEGPVRSVSILNIAEQTRQIAQGCQQAGAVMPLVVEWAKAKAGTDKEMEELVPLRMMSELLPSLGQIIGEFDFMESQLTLVQDGPQPGTWHEHRVMLIRPTESVDGNL